MFDDIQVGDTVSVSYISERSGNMVSRKGEVKQVPGDDKRVLFVKTDDYQLTGVVDGKVYSVSFDTSGVGRKIQRKTVLGEFQSISPA